jgi:hypothetical protein
MPNGQSGSRDEYLLQLAAAFEPVAQVLEKFGERHNLRLEKYYHEEPSWSFTFRHPSGGIGKIGILSRSTEGEGFDLNCSWWYDDYDSLKRHIKSFRKDHLPANPDILSEELERCLALVLSWVFGNWDEVHSGNKTWKKNWTREQFLGLVERYPIPK